ncbi:ABC transporter permease [Gordonia amicalis]|uniref:ABC transporter permease n=1 Tax=Gordonia amicalis TaxID=89053 RepID=UPI0002A6595D|nr:ABC transporter permease subunit [Gordonia amicalis]MBA5846156.1 ABC transporter permease subunit [Gordonia amicalis]MDV7102138.1 ABC transporter permease subunit [Gordonia amicalis]MDV7172724.1 ABC transporter permease subunit [Gordonia amicalis]NKX77134.1 ABC transporter permease subunit [Gordonia amicalis]UOG20506.1 ABC transporter permease subunit [Gordonia amicalis]
MSTEVRTLGSGGLGTGGLLAAGRFLGSLLLSFALILVIWWLFLLAFPDIGPIIGRTPVDVFDFLFVDADAPAARAEILDNLWITLQDAAIGFIAGMLAAIATAAIFVVSRSAAQTFMPIAMLLRSVPLVAMTPLITVIVGRGVAVVAVMGGIVVFFPALVMIMTGLSNAPRQITDVISVYGGGRWTALRRSAIPSAVPSLFSAAKVSVPGALIGATVAEWLGTNKGLGATLQQALPAAAYDELWASVLVITVASIVIYAVVGVIETVVLSQMGMQQT